MCHGQKMIFPPMQQDGHQSIHGGDALFIALEISTDGAMIMNQNMEVS